MQFKSHHILVLLTVTVVAGCGFTLRGTGSMPPQLQTLSLESTAGNTEILREMRRALIASNVTIVDQPQAGIYRLGLGDTQSSERPLSVNVNARAGEYELTVSVPYQLRSGISVVLGPEILSIEKVYLADPNNAVAKAEERELIEEEMRRELVYQIMRRLQNLTL